MRPMAGSGSYAAAPRRGLRIPLLLGSGALVLAGASAIIWSIDHGADTPAPIAGAAAPALRPQRAPSSAELAGATASAELTSGVASDDVGILAGRVVDLERQLQEANAKASFADGQLRVVRAENQALQVEIARLKSAIADALVMINRGSGRRAATPSRLYVSHLGEPYVTPIGGDGFEVSGQFYNAEDSEQKGLASIELFVGGLSAGTESVQLVIRPQNSADY